MYFAISTTHVCTLALLILKLLVCTVLINVRHIPYSSRHVRKIRRSCFFHIKWNYFIVFIITLVKIWRSEKLYILIWNLVGSYSKQYLDTISCKIQSFLVLLLLILFLHFYISSLRNNLIKKRHKLLYAPSTEYFLRYASFHFLNENLSIIAFASQFYYNNLVLSKIIFKFLFHAIGNRYHRTFNRRPRIKFCFRKFQYLNISIFFKISIFLFIRFLEMFFSHYRYLLGDSADSKIRYNPFRFISWKINLTILKKIT